MRVGFALDALHLFKPKRVFPWLRGGLINWCIPENISSDEKQHDKQTPINGLKEVQNFREVEVKTFWTGLAESA